MCNVTCLWTHDTNHDVCEGFRCLLSSEQRKLPPFFIYFLFLVCVTQRDLLFTLSWRSWFTGG